MNWIDYINKPDVVLNGKSPDGTRLVLLFAEDFKKRMGYDLDIGCPKCFRTEFNKFINSKESKMSKNKSEFKLKKKYQGLSMHGSKNTLSDKSIEMDENIALEFYANHKNGKALFDAVPKDIDKRVDAFKKLEAESKKAAAEEAKKAAQAKKSEEELNELISEAKEFGVVANKADGSLKTLSTLKKEVSAARTAKKKAEKESADAAKKVDAKAFETANKQPKEEEESSEEE